MNYSRADGASLCGKCGRDYGFTAAAEVEQRQGFGHDVASERRIYFLDDDVETAGAEVIHDLAQS